MYTVTRQLQWPEGTAVVEVSSGGLDYTNPDALVEKYPGEFEEFLNPIEAVETAISICTAWRQDGKRSAKIGIGFTCGMTMPFDTCTFVQGRKWARHEDKSLERCPVCGDYMPESKERWHLADDWTGEEYCSERCAKRAYESMQEVEEEAC